MRVHDFDVIVIGGGASGLRAAIAAKQTGAKVALITKVHPLRSHTAVAQGGLNAPFGSDDSVELFASDTLSAGDGLSSPGLVEILAQNACKEALWLESMGMPFNRNEQGRLDQRPFGSNSRNRTCYADDRTGHIVLQVLHEQFTRAGIPSFEEWFVTSLVVDEGAAVGAIALGLRSGKMEPFSAGTVILATGGFAYLYAPSTASVGTTGDGTSLAYSVGARMRDMEMVQYHPTVLPGNRPLLITEATLGEGAEITNTKGEAIGNSKVAARHLLCQAMHKAAENGGGDVYLDLRPIGKERLQSRFPQTRELVRLMAGLDITKEPVPVRPAAHRPMGGVETNEEGETSIPRLFAVGECACNGLNGAGRLAGNTLTESLVFGKVVGEAAGRLSRGLSQRTFPVARLSEEEKRMASIVGQNQAEDSVGKIHAELSRLMNDKVGLCRDGSGLEEALNKIRSLRERYQRLAVRNGSTVYNYELTGYLELDSMLTLADAVTVSALARTESRGAHKRSDFPERDDQNWRSHITVRLVGGSPLLEKKPALPEG